MRVICAGMSKTGTKSMHVALELLGYSPVYDYIDSFTFLKDYMRFTRQGWSVEDFRRIYANVDAIVDSPAYFFWEELLQAFPDAKVILTVRDDDIAWYNSLKAQYDALNGPYRYFYHIFGPGLRSFGEYADNPCALAFAGVLKKKYLLQYDFTQELLAKQQYRRHIAHVVNTCPKDKLLVFNVKEGWSPLCEFLQKHVPRKPFPRVNVKGALAEKMWEEAFLSKERKKIWRNFGLTCITVAAVTGAVRVWLSYR